MKGLGVYLKQLRQSKNHSLREAEKLLGVSKTFICDLENGYPFPTGSSKGEKTNLMEKYIEVYELDEKEAEKFKLMVDEALLDKSSNNVSYDIAAYLKRNQTAQQALRKATELNIKEEEWEDFLKTIEKNRNED